MSKSVRLTRQRQHQQVSSSVDRPTAAPTRELGDAEVSRPIVSGLAYPVQRKVVVGAAHDPAEAEAERVAAAVVASLSSGGSAEAVQRSADHEHGGGCGCSPVAVQRKVTGQVGLAGGELGADTERELRSASGGAPIEPVLRRSLEGAFDADFSTVRLHAGERATGLNDSMGAEAFTYGRDIYFREGLPDTSTASGLHLLGHELTHVVQQGQAPVQRTVRRKGKSNKSKNGGIDAARIGTAIAGGHAYQKHVVDEGQFPGVDSPAKFAKVVEDVIFGGDHKKLTDGRDAWWDGETVVIANPNAADNGTCFKPGNRNYFKNLT